MPIGFTLAILNCKELRRRLLLHSRNYLEIIRKIEFFFLLNAFEAPHRFLITKAIGLISQIALQQPKQLPRFQHTSPILKSDLCPIFTNINSSF